ncbi:LysM peptidoglycan-binding domain-containing protein [Rothia nasimurium]|uniref:LysM peptidoglycan-binding domain-containing protein n=1 Tax=Rothia nasimurium TaxID=85336 RepID=UPI001F3AE7F6|nr:LysM peptidoglycan-binding domain-containing protein [Rothia nasimurium]
MSTIALPEFMARTSLKKPLDQAATFTVRQHPQVPASAGALRQPQYRIRFAAPVSARPAPVAPLRNLPSHPAASTPAQRPSAVVEPSQKAKTGRGKIRLTRRGRLVFRGLPLLTLVALVVLGALTFLAPGEAKSATVEPVVPVSQTVTVVHGDTLWTIAADVAPGEDNRDVINRIMQINDLTSAQLVPGQVLEVPVYTQSQ